MSYKIRYYSFLYSRHNGDLLPHTHIMQEADRQRMKRERGGQVGNEARERGGTGRQGREREVQVDNEEKEGEVDNEERDGVGTARQRRDKMRR